MNKIIKQFKSQVKNNPDKIALVYGDKKISYKDLNILSNKIANTLFMSGIKEGDKIAILMDRSEYFIASIFAVIKIGAIFLNLDTNSSYFRIKRNLNNKGIKMLIVDGRNYDLGINIVGDINMKIISLETLLIENIKEINQQEYIDTWNFLGKEGKNSKEIAGWRDSYEYKLFSNKEIGDLYKNVYENIKDNINKKSKVLEIGVGSGLILEEICGKVSKYVGTDISENSLNYLENTLKANNIKNVDLYKLSAIDIDKIGYDKFDIIILNSVSQFFHNYSYFEEVLSKLLCLLNEKGIIYFGDVRDKNKQIEFYSSLYTYKKLGIEKEIFIENKIISEKELFFDKEYISSLSNKYNGVKFLIKNKIFTVENELSKYRFNIIIKKEFTRNLKIGNKYIYLNTILSQSGDFDIKCTNKLLYCNFTSGSTGAPKCVMVKNDSFEYLLDWYSQIIGDSTKCKNLLVAPHSFDLSIKNIFLPIINGGELYLLNGNSYDVNLIIDSIYNNKINTINLTPSLFYELVYNKDNYSKLETLTTVILGGEQINFKEISDWFYFSNSKIINSYGPTECTDVTTYHIIEKNNQENIIPIGKAINGYVDIKLFNTNGKEIKNINEEGELFISGVGVSNGYIVDNDNYNSNKFINDGKTYKTGDICKYNNNYDLVYVGRKDNQIKINGYRLDLSEIENHLNIFEEIKSSKVIHHYGKLILFFIKNNNFSFNESLLISKLKDYFPSYMIPSDYVSLDSFPMNNNGKIDSKKLLSIYLSNNMNTVNLITYNSEIEEKFYNILKNVLIINNIDKNDDLFAIGLNSLKAIKLMNLINKNFGCNVSIYDIFKSNTINDLFNTIEEDLIFS